MLVDDRRDSGEYTNKGCDTLLSVRMMQSSINLSLYGAVPGWMHILAEYK